VNTNCKEFGQDIQKEKMWTDASEAKLKEVIAGYKNLFTNGQ
jgi:hypothetical protein